MSVQTTAQFQTTLLNAYVSLEGYVDATVLLAALQRNGAQLDTEKLVEPR